MGEYRIVLLISAEKGGRVVTVPHPLRVFGILSRILSGCFGTVLVTCVRYEECHLRGRWLRCTHITDDV